MSVFFWSLYGIVVVIFVLCITTTNSIVVVSVVGVSFVLQPLTLSPLLYFSYTISGWGRGKNREAAMDCACRAAFALVAAHGYNNFPLDEDCLMQAPSDPLPPPPPPLPPNLHPPLPPGLPPYGHPHHLPPLPNGMPPLPPPPPATLPPSADLIPQARMISDAAPTASSLSSTLGSSSTSEVGGISTSDGKSNPVVPTISMSLNSANQGLSSELNTRNGKAKRKLKGGLSLVYGVDGEGFDEISMEETRALLPRYQKLLSRATSSSTANVSS